MAIPRRTRPKAGIPLLLKYMVEVASGKGGKAPVDGRALTDTLIVLTGREIDDPYKLGPGRPTAARDALAELVKTCWTPNKATLTLVGVHGRRQEPQLQDHGEEHQAEDAVNDGGALLARQRLAHTERSSFPTAYTIPPRTSSLMSGSGRRGGPASGRPVARSNSPR